MLSSCGFMAQRLMVPTYPPLDETLVENCADPIDLAPGDNIPAASVENAGRLRECSERHKKTVQVCKPA